VCSKLDVQLKVIRGKHKTSGAIYFVIIAWQLVGCGGTTTLVSMPKNESTTMPISDQQQTDQNYGTDDSPEQTIGDRAQPAPIGSTVQINDSNGDPLWEVTLLESNLNVNELIASENQFNSPPPAGFQFASAKVRVTYLGTDSKAPGWDLTLKFISSAGTTHDEFDVIVVGPNNLSNVNELYNGGTATANVYVAIPIMDSAKGTWRLTSLFLDTEFYFAAS